MPLTVWRVLPLASAAPPTNGGYYVRSPQDIDPDLCRDKRGLM